MKSVTRIVIVVAALAVVLGALFGWRFYQMRQQAEAMAQQPPPVVVETVVSSVQSWRESVRAIGSLRAVNGVEVANEVPGVVRELGFESGQRVAAGDVLIQLDAETDRAALETREAEARLALQQFERFRNLVSQNAVSKAEFDEAQANYEAAVARVEEQRALLAKKTIRAPFDGIVGLRMVDLGQFLEVGTPIVGINMLDPIQVDFTIPEQALPRVAVGDRVEIEVGAWPGQLFTGEVTALDSSVRSSTRTVQVRARLQNDERRLYPGMFAEVRTIRDQSRDVITVPRTAISYNTYGDFVFRVVDGAGGKTVERVAVTTGEVRDGQVEIVDGLEAGVEVVGAGLLRLRNGQAVSVAGKPNGGTERD